MHNRLHSQRGFTIVELLIVIVVIAILAAITMIAFSGVRRQANKASATTSLSAAKKQLEIYKVDNSSYPSSGNQSNAGIVDGSSLFQYTSNGETYCLTATVGDVAYNITESTSPTEGACTGHTAPGSVGTTIVNNLATNPSIESNTTSWYTAGTQTPAITRDTTEKHVGSASLRVRLNGSSYTGDAEQQRIIMNISGLTSGQQYTVSAFVKPSEGKRFHIHMTNSANTLFIQGPYSSTSSSWQRLSFTFAANASSMRINITPSEGAANTGLNSATTNYVSTPFVGYVDAIMLTQTSSLTPYGDGSSPGWSWSGSTNNSSSTGPV